MRSGDQPSGGGEGRRRARTPEIDTNWAPRAERAVGHPPRPKCKLRTAASTTEERRTRDLTEDWPSADSQSCTNRPHLRLPNA